MFRTLHNTARVFRNAVAKEVEQVSLEKGTDLDFSDIAHLVNGQRGREAEKQGDPDGGIWTAGQCVGLIDDIPTTKELVDAFVAEALEAMGKVQGMVVRSHM